MPEIIVVGGGVAGLATALMLAKQGHDITVLERDPGPVPDTPARAWEGWERAGVMQFRQPHTLQPAGWQVIERELPEVAQALRASGGLSWNRLSFMPPAIKDRAPRPGDAKFGTVNARRPVLERAFAAAAEGKVDVRRGVRVTGLVSDRPGHVSGVRVDPGAELRADLVIDAAGRRSSLPAWLAAVGAGQLAEEAQDRGFTYYSRFFRARDGGPAPAFGGDITTPLDSMGIVVIRTDDGTWSVTVYIDSRDQALKALRTEANWDRLLGACPLHERLVADLDPVTGVLPASGIVNRVRHLVVDGAPVATGILPVGDSWACTNPSLGRGVTLALMHAVITAEAVGEHLGDPLALALEHHRRTSERLMPWYLNSAQVDLSRLTQMSAASGGEPAPAAASSDTAATRMRNLVIGANWDADIFRRFCELTSLLARPDEIFARPGLTELVNQAAEGRQMPPPPGPSRAEVLALLS